jgi:hypothetical protein
MRRVFFRTPIGPGAPRRAGMRARFPFLPMGKAIDIP